VTPKEKAKSLVEKYYQNSPELFGTSKAMDFAISCALIAVDEIINAVEGKYDQYWIEVKKEINNLK